VFPDLMAAAIERRPLDGVLAAGPHRAPGPAR